MNKKSPVLGAVLGFFVLGLPYSGGMKKGLIGLVVLCIISWALASFVSPTVSIIVNFAGAFLGHTWANEYNANIDAQGVDSPATI